MRLAPWRMMVGSSVPSALMRRSMTSRATAIAWSVAAVEPALGLAHGDPVAVDADVPVALAAEVPPAELWPRAQSAAVAELGGIADEEAQLAAAGRDLGDVDAGPAHLAAHQLLHRLEPLAGDVGGLRLEQQMAAAGEVEAEIDVDLARPGRELGADARAGAGWARRGARRTRTAG